MRSRTARLGVVLAFLGGGSGSLRRTPRMDVGRAFGTWVRVSEARKVCVRFVSDFSVLGLCRCGFRWSWCCRCYCW